MLLGLCRIPWQVYLTCCWPHSACFKLVLHSYWLVSDENKGPWTQALKLWTTANLQPGPLHPGEKVLSSALHYVISQPYTVWFSLSAHELNERKSLGSLIHAKQPEWRNLHWWQMQHPPTLVNFEKRTFVELCGACRANNDLNCSQFSSNCTKLQPCKASLRIAFIWIENH